MFGVIAVVLFGIFTANALLQIVFTPFFWMIVLAVLVVIFFLERRDRGGV
jgi:hypothetical protein